MEIYRSARHHGVGDQDIRHAAGHPVVVADIDPDADPPKLLVIGPDRTGNLLEVVVVTLTDGKLLVIHAMPCAASTMTCSQDTVMTDKPKTYTTGTGKILTEADVERLAEEAERGYDVEELKSRRRGRPMIGSAPSEVVPVRLDPGLRQAVQARAEAEHTTTSEVIREALRHFLDVA